MGTYVELQSRIADELARTDLTSEIELEILSAVRWFSHQRFSWNEASMAQFTTVVGQRYYWLPANFVTVTDALSQIGNYTYKLDPMTEQEIDEIDWGDVFWTSYPLVFSTWSGQIRLFPPPQQALPVVVKGQIELLPLMTASASWAPSTAYAVGDTVYDSYNNVQTCITAGTSGTSAPAWPTNTPQNSSGAISGASMPPVVGQTTTDGPDLVWSLTGTNENAWTTQAEELIRSRALKNLYARYLRDSQQAEVMQKLETDALANLRQKNFGSIALSRITPHF